jgi:F-type H+-transporting ATPase subunit delta
MIDPVTNRYAEALFELARKQGCLDAVRADVTRLSEELSNATVRAFFFESQVTAETRREKLTGLLGGMHELTRNFVNLLFDKRRIEVLRDLGAAFHQRTLEQERAAEGVVESARPLGSSEIELLAKNVGDRLGKQVTLRNDVVPELVGGVRVLVENRMLDTSVQGRMDALRKRMLEAPLPGSSGT